MALPARRVVMKRIPIAHVIAAFALALTGTTDLRASWIEGAVIEPSKPTSDAPVALVFAGSFHDGCQRTISAAVEEETGQEAGKYTVTLEVRGDFSIEPEICPDIVVPFSHTVVLGFPRLRIPYTVDAVLVEDGERTEYPDLATFQVGPGDISGIVGVTTIPDRPTGAGPFVLVVHGVLIGCGVEYHSMVAEVDTTSRRIRAAIEIGIPPIMCLVPEPFQYSGEAAIGPLPVGKYSVDVDLAVDVGGEIQVLKYPDAWTVEVFERSSTSGEFLRGDSNGDLTVDISDAVHILTALFLGGGAPACADAADADDSGELDITDAVSLLEFLFLAGKAPPAPGPEGPAGPDPTPDDLGCGSRA
jgi:hypothetical protein